MPILRKDFKNGLTLASAAALRAKTSLSPNSNLFLQKHISQVQEFCIAQNKHINFEEGLTLEELTQYIRKARELTPVSSLNKQISLILRPVVPSSSSDSLDNIGSLEVAQPGTPVLG